MVASVACFHFEESLRQVRASGQPQQRGDFPPFCWADVRVTRNSALLKLAMNLAQFVEPRVPRSSVFRLSACRFVDAGPKRGRRRQRLSRKTGASPGCTRGVRGDAVCFPRSNPGDHGFSFQYRERIFHCRRGFVFSDRVGQAIGLTGDAPEFLLNIIPRGLQDRNRGLRALWRRARY